jgi:hypothetical protein
MLSGFDIDIIKFCNIERDSKLETQSPQVGKGALPSCSGRCSLQRCTIFIGDVVLLGLSHRTALRELWGVVTLHDSMHACMRCCISRWVRWDIGALGGTGNEIRYFGTLGPH